MAETSLPTIETANCISCKDEKSWFAMIQTSESDKDQNDGTSSWMCWNCAYERGMTNERSLEGFLIWCVGCNNPIFWDNSNRCHECMVPQDPDEGFCDDCWDDKSNDWIGKESNESFSETHKDCS